ncbi:MULTISPECIES: ATP-binding protein [Segatella]|jgi:predicted AAA+ superfamily ATPase|uniref:ATP-binding protein n=1 Tax=Segatella copri TaxID=165179 RepID=A0AA92W4M6_9BACT|nr:AAA family ATPase [Segatella copri]RGV01707.1 ATP-binding protein [Segatella copri]RHA89532.1 ATP-binding protein [Segatella copri]RHK47788.1 ATP-binding protein [Segatella copri]
MDITLINYMKEQLELVSLAFKRYNYDKLPWEARLVGLMGPRGVGKSTLILQHIKSKSPEEQAKSLYVSADHSYFTTSTLIETANQFVREGGEWLYIDEVHKYEGWSQELKQIYDSHPGLHVFFTGSSILDIIDGEADLSRRVILFDMQGLSFREYLEMFHGIKTPIRSLEDILNGKTEIEGLQHPIPLFNQYLREGYYPFSKEGFFQQRLQQVIRLTMEVDIPQYANMSPATGKKLRRMLSIIASNVPYKPEATGLANEIKVSRNDIPTYLLYMEKAGMIGQLRDETGGMRGLGKTEKVYLDNTNIIYALSGENANIGNVRETFFYNQTRLALDVTSSKVSDFSIGKYTFEVGGAKKSHRQIKDVANSFIVRDDTEYANGDILPLWAFGLLY